VPDGELCREEGALSRTKVFHTGGEDYPGVLILMINKSRQVVGPIDTTRNWVGTLSESTRVEIFKRLKAIEFALDMPIQSASIAFRGRPSTFSNGRSHRLGVCSRIEVAVSVELGYSLANLNQANERIADINSIHGGEHPIVFEVSNATWVDNSRPYNVLQPPLIISKKDEVFSRFLQGRHTRYDLETLLAIFDVQIERVHGRTDPLVRALVAHSECVLMINRLVGTSLLYAAAVKGVAEPCFPRTFRGVSHHLERELPALGFRPFPRTLHAARVILSGSTLEEMNEQWVSARREHPRIEADLANVHTRIRLALEQFRCAHQESSRVAPSKSELTGIRSGCDPDLASAGIWDASERRFIPIHLGDGEDELHCPGLKVEHDELGFSFEHDHSWGSYDI